MSVLYQKRLQLLMISSVPANVYVYFHLFFNQRLNLSNTLKIYLYSILSKFL